MNRSRKRKRMSIDNDGSKIESRSKRIKTETFYREKKRHSQVVASNNSPALIANARDVRISLDKSIVVKYFQAKQVLREILSPCPRRIHSKDSEKSRKKKKKKTSLLDYLLVKSDPLNSSSSSTWPLSQIENLRDSTICQNTTIKDEARKESSFISSDVDQNNSLTLDVNMPVAQSQIIPNPMYCGDNCQSNCNLLDSNMMVIPASGQFTREEFIYNNCGFGPFMGVPIKTEFFEDLTFREEFDETMDSRIMTYDPEIPDITSIEEMAMAASSTVVKVVFDEKAIKPSDEKNYKPVKFDKRGFSICFKCNRRFKVLEAFTQHQLLCGSELLYECLYCTYGAKLTSNVRKHVEKFHKLEVKDKGLEKIVEKIRKNRMDKKILTLMFKESKVDSGVEEGFAKSSESKFTPSKLTFDLFCQKCEKSFKRMNGIPNKKTCPDCQLTLEFKCQTCGQSFSTYSKVYNHVSTCGSSAKTKISTSKRRSSQKSITNLYNCEQCDFKTACEKTFRDHTFQQHMKNDTSTFFKCELCSFESHYEKNFKRHNRNLHGVNETIHSDD